MKPDLPVWRSMLFVPVTAQRFVEGAARRGADAIILDLEDAVAASEKDRARTLVPEAAAIVSRGGADVVVRINRPMRMTVRDLEAVIGPGVQAIALPKAESARARPARRRDHRRARGRARHGDRHDQDAGDGRDLLGLFPHPRDRQGASRGWSRSISGPRISPFPPGCCPRPRVCSCPSRPRSLPRAAPASCRWGLSARSPISATSTPSARPCAARAGSAFSAPR